jgi:hypothetical protein
MISVVGTTAKGWQYFFAADILRKSEITPDAQRAIDYV